MAAPVIPVPRNSNFKLTPLANFPRMRVLAWDKTILYASRGYEVFRAELCEERIHWQWVAHFRPKWWRNLSSSSRLGFRAFRDGFHTLAALSSGHLVAAVAGAIVRLCPRETEFRISHRILRGTRPLHMTSAPDGKIFWGEYFDNPARDEVHIYVSEDYGANWGVAYTFSSGTIRHVHNIVFDEWRKCLWILTGDNGNECRILRASCDFSSVETVLMGTQQSRAAALVPTRDAVYFSSDTPCEQNHIYRLHSDGRVTLVHDLPSSSIYGCGVRSAIFFSTMVEPSEVNLGRHVHVYGGSDEVPWRSALQWKKDPWPM